jgi:hypothetical protein
MRHALAVLPLLSALFGWVQAQGKTHIYIDQVPLYSSLRQCAQDRISAIVRAQASGCGDEMQLTSFSCFCIDSSTAFASIISTAIVEQCGSDAMATTTRGTGSMMTTTNVMGNVAGRVRARASVETAMASPTLTGAVAQDVKDALDLFGSYCAKSTQLTKCTYTLFFHPSHKGYTLTYPKVQQPETVTVTSSPQPTSEPSRQGKRRRKSGTLIAVIVISSILVLFLLIAGVLFFLYQRRKHATQQNTDRAEVEASHVSDITTIAEKDVNDAQKLELGGCQQQRQEMP